MNSVLILGTFFCMLPLALTVAKVAKDLNYIISWEGYLTVLLMLVLYVNFVTKVLRGIMKRKKNT